MCCFSVEDRYFVPGHFVQNPNVVQPSSSESKIYKAVCQFFLACTAISGVAFLLTISPEMCAASVILGLITLCLYCPDTIRTTVDVMVTSAKVFTVFDRPTYYSTRRDFMPRREVIVREVPVFVDRPVERPRDRRNHPYEIPVDAFNVAPTPQYQERHERDSATRPVYQPPVQPQVEEILDPQARHSVGGRNERVQDDLLARHGPE